MRIDQQQCVVTDRVRRRDGDAIRAARLLEQGAGLGGVKQRQLPLAIESLQLFQRDAFDVAADAAFAEAERHPRLEPADHARRRLRMLIEVEVQPVGPGVHQLFQPVRAGCVFGLQVHRIDEQLHAQVLIDRALPFGLGQAAHGVQVVGLDAVEVVFRLGVDHAEHRIGVGGAMHMGDAPVVTDDADPLRFAAPAGQISGFGRVGESAGPTQENRYHQNKDELERNSRVQTMLQRSDPLFTSQERIRAFCRSRRPSSRS